MVLTQQELIRKYGISAKKALGQNFLCDEGITSAIADALQAGEDELVFEIGPGLGALTCHLAGGCAHYAAIELDSSLIPILRGEYATAPNTYIIQADALKFDFDAYAAEAGFASYKIIGNLPYYITTPIIMHILENCRNWHSLVFMMQKEVAERLASACGGADCGAITYAVSYRADCQQVLEVPPTAFIPRPEVDSAVLRFERKPEPPVQTDDEEFLFRVIKAGFAQRRKTLLNSLANSGIAEKQKIRDAFSACDIDEKRRGETLTLEEYNALANALK
ncbi:MAG: ribosomal RNA small subunit methyltransferase A [Firmicutes bacterium]|nr:ribosomal RNA small subunit methyltransferase A [Bacillota bacterium]